MRTELRKAWQVLLDALGRWLVDMWVGVAFIFFFSDFVLLKQPVPLDVGYQHNR